MTAIVKGIWHCCKAAVVGVDNALYVIGTAIWLLSDASAFVTGQTISVDGGTVLA